MKPMMIALLMIYTATCYCQQSSSSSILSAADYKKKSKDQRIGAGIAGVLGLGSMLYGFGNMKILSNEQPADVTISMIAGTVLLLSTIPLIIASDRNSKKAKAVFASFKLQRTPSLIAAIKSTAYYPSVGIRISL